MQLGGLIYPWASYMHKALDISYTPLCFIYDKSGRSVHVSW